MVKVNVKFSVIFRDTTGTTAVAVDVPGANVNELIDVLTKQFGKNFGDRVTDPKTGEIRRFVNVFVNGKDIRNLDGANTKLEENSEVRFIPAVAGGEFQGFTEEQIRRYSRQIILKEVGGKGQKKISRSKVLIVGAGGLGAPAALYVAAAGVGTIGLIDCDNVDLSNLHRQIIHFSDDVGRPKIKSAEDKIRKINPEVEVVGIHDKFSVGNAFDVLNGWDFVIDGSDNFPTKFLLNDACVLKKIPFAHGGVLRFVGMATTILPFEGPCYRCLTPEAPPQGMIPTCQEAGVIGVVPGVIGSIQASECLKYLLGVGSLLVGRIVFFDALEMKFEEFEIMRKKECPICGEKPVIKDLSQVDYGHVCEVKF